MKKLGALFILLTMTSASVTAFDTTVYICNGPYSKKYHYKSSCRGLGSCSTAVEKVTLQQAREKGRTLCGHED